jgi:hypothetical protein
MPLALLVSAALAAAPPPLAMGPPEPLPPPAASDPDAERLLWYAVRNEPSVDEVQRAAAARAGPGPEVTERWRHRARLAPIVPKVVAEYRHDDRSTHVVGLTAASEVDYLRETPGDTVALRLSWDLDGLVFSRAELDAVAAAQRADARRRAAVDRATRLYFERLRLKLDLATTAPAGAARARLELELEAVSAELRALTGLGAETP